MLYQGIGVRALQNDVRNTAIVGAAAVPIHPMEVCSDAEALQLART